MESDSSISPQHGPSKGKMSNKKLRRDVICGHYQNLQTYIRVQSEYSHLVRLYLASSNQDTKVERDILAEKVVPELRQFCRERGLEFQLIDLKWGVPVTKQEHLLNWEICHFEISLCSKLSVGPCYFLLLTDRLGDGSLPSRIPLPLFDHICAILFRRRLDPNRINRWYKMDKNVVPLDYVLKREELESNDANKDGSVTNDLMSLLTQGITVAFTENKLGEYAQRLLATGFEWTTYMAMLSQEVEKGRAMCAVREFSKMNLTDKQAAIYTNVNQAHGANKRDSGLHDVLDTLKNDIFSEDSDLLMDKPYHFSIPWTVNGLDPSNETHNEYLENLVSSSIEEGRHCITQALKGRRNSPASDWLFEEVSHHVEYGREVRHCLHVRNNVVEQVLVYLAGKDKQPFIIYGDRGSGKTLMLGKIALKAHTVGQDETVVITRFLGTSIRSLNLVDVLKTLILQICEAFGIPFPIGSVTHGLSELTYCFEDLIRKLGDNDALSKKSLVLIIDAIELLYSGQTQIDFSWLQMKLPNNVKIVISSRLSKEQLEAHFGGQVPQMNMVYIDPLGEKGAQDIFDAWVHVEGRHLTKGQRDGVHDLFRYCTHPLYLRLVFMESRKWTSNCKPNVQELVGSSVAEAVELMLNRLELRHGKVLVEHAVGYLLIARDGLAEYELEDVLSLDDAVLKSVYETVGPPTGRVGRLPHIIWARLRLDFDEHLISCYSCGTLVLKFKRSILQEIAEERYLNPGQSRTDIHNILADYFLGVWSQKVKPIEMKTGRLNLDRKVPPQPIRFGMSGPANFRKLLELPYHLLKSQRTEELLSECFANYEWVATVSKMCSIDNLLRDISMTLRVVGNHELELVLETIELIAMSTNSERVENPLAVDVIGRLLSLEKRYPKIIGKLVKGARLYCDNPRRPILVPQRPCFPSPCGAAVERLRGHQGGTVCLDLSPDGATLLSGGADGAVKVWDLNSVQMVRSIQYKDEITFVALLTNTRRAVMVAGNKIHIMDLQTGDTQRVLDVHQTNTVDDVTSLNFNDVTSSKDVETPQDVIKISADEEWMVMFRARVGYVIDLVKMEIQTQLLGHSDVVTCLGLSERGKLIITGSFDETVRVWNSEFGHEFYVFEHHTSVVTGVAVSTDDRAVSVSLDGAISIFHLKTGNILKKLKWHRHSLYSVSVNSSGTRLAVGSFGEIGLWDVQNGRLVSKVAGHRKNISRIEYVSSTNSKGQVIEKLMSMSSNGELKIWNTEHDDLSHSASGSVGKDAQVKVAANKAAMGSTDSPFLKVWSLNFDPEQTTTPLEGGIYDPIAISADGKYVITVHSNSTDLVLYDVSKGVELHQIPAHDDKVTCLTMLSVDEHVISGSRDGVVKMWRRDGEILEKVHSTSYNHEIKAIAAHPRSLMVAILHDKNIVRLRHMNNKDVDEAYIDVQDSNVTQVIMGDDQIIYGTDIGKIYVWSYENLDNPVIILEEHLKALRHLTVREKYLASVGEDEQTVVIWNCKSGKKLGDMYTGEEKVMAVTWSNDMHHLIIGFETNHVHIYDVIAQTKLTSLNVYSPVSAIVANSDIISISTTGGYLGVYKLVVSDSFDPSIYSDSLESRYSVSSLQASRAALQQSGERRRSTTCTLL